MKKPEFIVSGQLEICAAQFEDELDGEKMTWNEVLIHGDPAGLRSLANFLLELADLSQEHVSDLPAGAKYHDALKSGYELTKSSDTVIIGRLDAK